MRFTNLQILQKYTTTFYKTAHNHQKCAIKFHWENQFLLEVGGKRKSTRKHQKTILFENKYKKVCTIKKVCYLWGNNRNVRNTLNEHAEKQ